MMNFEAKQYIVYVRTDDLNRIKAINSSVFISNTDGWTEIDRGYTQRHYHAQGNYLENSLYDDRGIMRYKLIDGQPVERTQKEMDADWAEPTIPQDTKDVEIAQLKEQVTALSAAFLNL